MEAKLSNKCWMLPLEAPRVAYGMEQKAKGQGFERIDPREDLGFKGVVSLKCLLQDDLLPQNSIFMSSAQDSDSY